MEGGWKSDKSNVVLRKSKTSKIIFTANIIKSQMNKYVLQQYDL